MLLAVPSLDHFALPRFIPNFEVKTMPDKVAHPIIRVARSHQKWLDAALAHRNREKNLRQHAAHIYTSFSQRQQFVESNSSK